MADNPTQGEYQLHIPAGFHGGSGGDKASSDAVGSSQGSSALPVLLVGFVAIGAGGAAIVYLRRRRSQAMS